MKTTAKPIYKCNGTSLRIKLCTTLFFLAVGLILQAQTNWVFKPHPNAVANTTTKHGNPKLFGITNDCPPNIGFEDGNFAQWSAYEGSAVDSNDINITTSMQAVSPPTNAFILTNASSGNDTYGGFPRLCPFSCAGSHSMQLGNDEVNAVADRASYTFTVPNNHFVLTYYYAVVFQDPDHLYAEQPRFIAEVIDDATNTTIDCARFDYTSTASLPGFKVSPISKISDAPILYKEWTPVIVNLTGYGGRTLRIEFTSEDCALGAHFGYAYVDVCTQCSAAVTGVSYCLGASALTVNGPAGYGVYNWWNKDFTKKLGTGQTITFSPPLPNNDTINLDLVPYPGFGCRDTAYTTVTVNTIGKPSYSTTNASFCHGGSYNFNGSTYTYPGIYTTTLTNASGCDSTATLVLTQKKSTTSTSYDTLNAGGSFNFNGTTYSIPGTYQAHLTNSAGCDSTAILQLSITGPYIYSFTPTNGCPGTVKTIKGVHFTGTTAVSIGGIAAASFTVLSDTTISAVIDSAVGKVVVTTLKGTATSVGSYKTGKSVVYAYIAKDDGTVKVVNLETDSIVSTIQAGVYLRGVCVSPDGTKVYVTDYYSNNVIVINTLNNNIVGTIPVGNSPQSIVVSPDGTKVYAANFYSSTVSVIDAITYKVLHTVNVGARPIGITINPDGRHVYVSNSAGNSICVINTLTNVVDTTIALAPPFGMGITPYGIVASPDGKMIYVVGGSIDSIYCISTATNAIVNTFPLGSSPEGITISPDGKTLYVTNASSNSVSVININNGSIAKVLVGYNPQGISISPDGTKVVVVNKSDWSISIINTSTDTVIATVTVAVVSFDDSPGSFGNFIANVPSPCSLPQLSITSFTPISGCTGATITIRGRNLMGATSVSFGGVAAASYIVVNDSTIKAVVGNGASGSVSVSTYTGTASLAGFVYGTGVTSTSQATICKGSTYTFNGKIYNDGGTYTAKLTSSSGCDSIATLLLTAVPKSYSTTVATIIQGGSYTFNGSTYTSVGTYTAHLTNSWGCDSVATLILTSYKTSTSTTNAAICAGTAYFFNGLFFNNAGTYVSHLKNSAGNDSLAKLVLTVKTAIDTTIYDSMHIGTTYLYNGNTYNYPGSYTNYFISNSGCDSTVTLILKIDTSYGSTSRVTICNGSSYNFNGQVYTAAGTYLAHLTNELGYDSTAKLVLTLASPSSITYDSICPGGAFTFNGTVYNTAGNYVKHFTSYLGCDSTATLALTVMIPRVSTITLAIPDTAFPYKWNGLVIANPGTFTAYLTNSFGCDSAATLILTIKRATSSWDSINVCLAALPYSWNSLIFNAAGTQTAHLTNSVGYDSAATLVLTVTQLPAVAPIKGADTICAGTNTQLQNDSTGGVWASSNINIAKVDNGGNTKGILQGMSTISYSVSNKCGTTHVTKSITIIPAQISIPPIVGDTVVCVHDSTLLSNKSPYGSWNSSNASVASITSMGMVKGVNAGTAIIQYSVPYTCGNQVEITPIIVSGTKPTSTIITPNNPTCIYPLAGSVDVKVLGLEAPYQFSINTTPYTFNTHLPNLAKGAYTILVENKNDCLVDSVATTLILQTDNNCGDTLYVPTAFIPTKSIGSPNRCLKAFGGTNLKSMRFRVFNRFGNLLFETKDVNQGWDGTVNGKLQDVGTYIWYMEYTLLNDTTQTSSGTSVLIR